MKPVDIRQLSNDEISAKLADARQELMNLRFQFVTGQLTDTSRLKQTRREVARFETVLNERVITAEEE